MKHHFQTPPEVAEYMVSLLPYAGVRTVLEPTPGDGNLVFALKDLTYPVYEVTAPKDFFKLSAQGREFDAVVMNPPFSSKYTFGVPRGMDKQNMGWQILQMCMQMSHNIVALVPWTMMINSSARLLYLRQAGLRKVVALPRKVFAGSRVQSCIIVLTGNPGDIVFEQFDY